MGIRQEVLQRTTNPDYNFHLGKVKAHTGATGNEMADKVAGKASSGQGGHGNQHTVLVRAKKYHKMYWPYMAYKHKTRKRKRKRRDSVQHTATNEVTPYHWRGYIQDIARAQQQNNTRGRVYATMWQDTARHICPVHTEARAVATSKGEQPQ